MELPRPTARPRDNGGGVRSCRATESIYEHLGADILASVQEQEVGRDGMKIDRMFFERFEDTVRADPVVVAAVKAGQWNRVIDYVNSEVFDKPEDYYSLNKLRKAAAVDRRITLREILEKVFGLIPHFKSKDELLEEEFAKFVADYIPEPPSAIPAIKHYFKAYVTSDAEFARLSTSASSWISPPTQCSPPVTFAQCRREFPRTRAGIHQGLHLFEPVRCLENIAMLDTDTKRRIDTARDILVGKVPDPKSQVEQITIALDLQVHGRHGRRSGGAGR